MTQKVGIIGGVRIPFCRSNTAYKDVGNLGMSIRALGGLVEKHGLHDAQLGDVAMGAVIKHSSDWNLAREAVLGSGLSPYTPGITMQRACGTSLDTVLHVGNKIALGQIESGVGGGSDTVSDVPIVYQSSLQKRMLDMNRAKSFSDKLKAWKNFSPRELKPNFPGVGEPRTGMSMGQHCEVMAKRWHINRLDQDELAYLSHRKAAKAYEEGFFDDLLVPFRGVTRDNNLRADTSLEKLGTLKPVFDRKSGGGTLTAGNSSALTDGAATVLLGSESWAKARGLDVQAWLVDAEVAAIDFVPGTEGLLMAPVFAVARLLQRHQLSFEDFDFIELHEAFAAQVLCNMKAWEDEVFCKEHLGLDKPLGSIDRANLNVVGSSLALGHPFAATGARLVGTLAKLLAQKGSGRGLISICTAGGMGVAAILER